jgi:hypothetical protein
MSNSHLLLGMYCIISLHYLVPISANSITGPSSSVTQHSKITIQKLSNEQIITTSAGRHGKIGKETVNYGRLDKVPMATTTWTEQTAPETAQNNARDSLTNLISPKMAISVRNIITQSAQEFSFPDEFPNMFHYGNKKDFTHSVNDCENDTLFCKKQVFNREGLQKRRDFKLNNQIPWDNQDYGNNYHYSDEDTYIPGPHYRNVELPYNQRTESSSRNMYYEHPSQEDINRISDAHTQTHHNIPSRLVSRFPKVIFSLLKPTTTDLTGQSFSVNSNTWQDSLAMSQDNGGDKVEPIQEVKKNIFTSRGWGAGGMPFNALYMLQQQHMKPASRSAVAGSQQLVAPAPLHALPTASQYQQSIRNALSSALTAGSNGGGSGTPLPTRRQYSIIPQLYVSYGWGPHGK